jgi:sec-independent protein translocase protein TatA
MHSLALPVAGLLGLGTPEIVLVFFVVLLLFGGSKLPGLARGLGQSIREFKKASADEDETEKKTTK